MLFLASSELLFFYYHNHYLSTIRRQFALFVDYSHYSPTIRTIRTIRYTILLLSIAKKREPFSKPNHPPPN